MMTLFKPLSLPNFASFAMLLMRLVIGSAFILHGWQKIQTPMSWMPPSAPIPGFLQLLAAISEFGGGIAWVLGLLTPLAALGIAITMAVAASMHLFAFGDPFVNLKGGSSAEMACAYFVVAMVIMAVGPGKFSLDRKIFGERL